MSKAYAYYDIENLFIIVVGLKIAISNTPNSKTYRTSGRVLNDTTKMMLDLAEQSINHLKKIDRLEKELAEQPKTKVVYRKR